MNYSFYVLPGYFFGLIAGIVYFKHLPKSYRLVLALLAIAIFCDCYGYYLVKYLKVWNVWVFNIYMLLEIWLMGGAALFLVKQRKVRAIFLSLLVLNTLIWTIEILSTTLYQSANFAMVSYSISLAAIYIFVLLNNSLFSKQSILKLPVFWLAASAILYFGCMVPYLGLNNFLYQKFPNLANSLYRINTALNLIRYPLVAVSFIMLGRQSKSAASMLRAEIAKI